MMGKGWTVTPRAPAATLDGLGIGSPLLAQLLLNRGITDAGAAARFLEGRSDPPDPHAMAGMVEALARISRAVETGEPVVIYGDYDVDGLSAATLLALALRAVGARVRAFIPHRERDGYGLNADVLDRLVADGARLVVSVDCGVSAVAEVDRAAGIGLDVVVTDHHHVPARLPAAVAVINPHRPECGYPFKQLAGAGVALRLAQAIVRASLPRRQGDPLEDRLYELAALGTVADVMPLVGENREIVRRGLERINHQPCPGLAALLERAGLSPGSVDAEALAFRLAPRLNAAGRVADAELAYRLLSSSGADEAAALAAQIEALNAQRRSMTHEALARAREEVAALGDLMPPAVVVCGDYPAGVVGLVAARLAEETGRPTAVLRHGPDVCRGSVRGAAGVDVAVAVGACGDLLAAFGGHAAAAGLSVAPANLEAFRDRFAAAVAAQAPRGPAPKTRVADCRLRATSIDLDLCDLLARLEPCGAGNTPPLFEGRGFRVAKARAVNGGHLRLTLAADEVRRDAIMFDGARAGPRAAELVDILFRIRRHRWLDVESPELEIVDWCPSEA